MKDPRPYVPVLALATKIITLGCLMILVAWDSYVGTNFAQGDTISEWSLWCAMRSFTLPAIAGILNGHLFWPGEERNKLWVVGVSLLSVLAFNLVIDGLSWAGVIQWEWLLFIRSMPIITVLAYTPVGRFAWPQKRTVLAILKKKQA